MKQKEKPEVWDIQTYNDGLKLSWLCKNCGFGELDIFKNPKFIKDDPHCSEKPFLVYTECMGEEFYKEVLESFVQTMFEYSEIKE